MRPLHPLWRSFAIAALGMLAAVLLFITNPFGRSKPSADSTGPERSVEAPADTDPKGQEHERHRISGRVLVEATGRPIGGARVQVLIGGDEGNAAPATLATGHGDYSIVLPVSNAPAVSRWRVTLPGGEIAEGELGLLPGKGETIQDIKVPVELTVTGSVRAASGAPLPSTDVEIWLSSNDTRSRPKPYRLATDAKGEFVFFILNSAGFELVSAKPVRPGYRFRRYTLPAAAMLDELGRMKISAAVPEVRYEMEVSRNPRISGVVHGKEGQPVPDAKIRIRCAYSLHTGATAASTTETTTDGQGRFASYLAYTPAHVTLYVQSEGHCLNVHSLGEVRDDQDHSEVLIRLTGGIPFEGRIVRSDDRAVSAVIVKIVGSPVDPKNPVVSAGMAHYTTKTDDEGRFRAFLRDDCRYRLTIEDGSDDSKDEQLRLHPEDIWFDASQSPRKFRLLQR